MKSFSFAFSSSLRLPATRYRPPVSPLSSKPLIPTPPNTTAKQKEGEKRTRTLKLHAYPVGNRLDALCPESLVELGVEADVGGTHGLLGELDYGLDGMGGPLLERTAVHALVQVDGVLPGDDVLGGRARLAGLMSTSWDTACVTVGEGRTCL